MKLKIQCDWCGNVIMHRMSHKNRNKHFFCCKECSYQFKSKKVLVKCDWCEKEFLKKESDIKRTKHDFCSHKCSVDFYRWTGLNEKNAKVDGKEIHRKIVEEATGRELLPNEEVHHIDFNHHNNNLDNLEVLSKSKHAKIHAARKGRGKDGRFIKT
ncbi:HNH endonuclease [Clostridium tyrobutyricum DIVETGP]|uniref:HNH endonuclease n=1 Tax=Clostridium tyrobutyricum DIVETGP TaxID=1408889 RepID=W6N7J2_CLOTY|nr:HNH endonuclease [Clostridium tyrobutyricum]AND85584.1 hypothetical protein CTK_C23360 [Clostridium tyrobutyricum]ANP70110.1 hypothetical protein BA182_10580 [Clostridium tyrobutyricum]MBV4433742.1 HNH endonuclease [Clostridium tyrobutyricum]CDL92486.1 HNH endonuclease [Clostridium tyrobutyricum DIVETGP]